MNRAGFASLSLVCLFAAGCCTCAAPYDYCASTFTGQCGEDCRPNARIGSAFSGPMIPTTYFGPEEVSPEEVSPEEVSPFKIEGGAGGQGYDDKVYQPPSLAPPIPEGSYSTSRSWRRRR